MSLTFNIKVKLLERQQWNPIVRSHEQIVLPSGELSEVTWIHSLLLLLDE